MTIKIHFSNVRPNAFGGNTTGSLCNRLRTMTDGMNLTGDRAKVTCAFCLKALTDRDRRTTLYPPKGMRWSA